MQMPYLLMVDAEGHIVNIYCLFGVNISARQDKKKIF